MGFNSFFLHQFCAETPSKQREQNRYTNTKYETNVKHSKAKVDHARSASSIITINVNSHPDFINIADRRIIYVERCGRERLKAKGRKQTMAGKIDWKNWSGDSPHSYAIWQCQLQLKA